MRVDGSLQGTATDFAYTNVGDQITNDGSLWTFNLINTGIGTDGAASMATQTLAVSISYGYINKTIANDAAYTAGTLEDGVPGQILIFHIQRNAGSETFVLTPDTSTEFESLSFNAAEDYAVLLYIDDTIGWVIIADNSVTVKY